ncbi:MAG: ABC transporter substrate-binding protein [Hyphomicrobiales bacterium]
MYRKSVLNKFTIFVISILISVLIVSCNRASKTNYSKSKSSFIEYADCFLLDTINGICRLQIINDKYPSPLAQYFLINRDEPIPDTLSQSNIIRIPVQRIACLVSSEIEALNLLNENKILCGISDKSYFNDDTLIQKRVKNMEIKELSKGGMFNVEKALEVQPEVIMMSWFDGQDFSQYTNLGLKIIPDIEYLEQNPLGRAEWIKLYGLLTGKQNDAYHIFEDIKSKYLALKNLTKGMKVKPLVISGKLLGDIWYAPGGNSYVASMFRDSGVDYPWYDVKSSGGIPLNIETVLSKGQYADFWRLNASIEDDKLYEALYSENILYSHFKAFKEMKILYCNIDKTRFFQKSSYEPHFVLSDYIHAFYPDLLPGYSPKYYKIISKKSN